MSFNPIIVRLKPELGIPTASFPNLFQSYNSSIKTHFSRLVC